MNHDVCLVNPFRCKIMHKKAVFEMLTDDQRQDWFTSSEKEAIRRTVPWTRRVFDRKTTRKGQKINLLEFIRSNRSMFVLKPNDDYGGHGIHFGSQMDEREWQSAIEKALSADYIVQDALDFTPQYFQSSARPIGNCSQCSLIRTHFFRGKVCGAMVLYPPRQSSTSRPAAANWILCFAENSARPEFSNTTADMKGDNGFASPFQRERVG